MYQSYFYFIRRGVLFTNLLMLGALCSFVLGACGGSGASTGASSSQVSNAPITVWVDADRMTAVKLYEQNHPDAKINAVVVDRNQFPAKVLLENNIQSGWPDVVFAEPNSGCPGLGCRA